VFPAEGAGLFHERGNTNVLPAMRRMTGSICFFSRTSWQYLLSMFTPGSINNNSIQPHFETDIETISDLENVGRQCRRHSAEIYRIISIAAN